MMQPASMERPATGMGERGLLGGITNFFTQIMRKWLPDPFIFAILLTLLTIILGMVIEGKSVLDMGVYWGKGYWNLLAFTTQVVVMLITGYVLARAPIIEKLLNALCGLVSTPRGATILVTVVGAVGSYLNWGFGLIIGAIMARKLAGMIKGIHYPLLIACGYSGFVLYGLGISGTIPLMIATKGHFLEKEIGIIPLSQTVFSPAIIIMALVLLVTLPILNTLIMPKKPEDIIEIDPKLVEADRKASKGGEQTKDRLLLTPAERLERSPIISVLMGVLGLGYVAYLFSKGGTLDLNTINFILFFGSILLHGTPMRFIVAFREATAGVGGVIMQYPIYAGIMSMMGESGLAATIGHWFLNISNQATLPFWGIVSSFWINFFAPSGGGHYVIQGPFMAIAAKAMGADQAKVAMSVMLGNAWNDLIQPFWLLPILALSGLNIRHIMGYTVMACIWSGLVLCVGTLIWGFF